MKNASTVEQMKPANSQHFVSFLASLCRNFGVLPTTQKSPFNPPRIKSGASSLPKGKEIQCVSEFIAAQQVPLFGKACPELGRREGPGEICLLESSRTHRDPVFVGGESVP
jgi:hypothetical protein